MFSGGSKGDIGKKRVKIRVILNVASSALPKNLLFDFPKFFQKKFRRGVADSECCRFKSVTPNYFNLNYN